MKLIEKMAKESAKAWAAPIPENAQATISFWALYPQAYEAGFRACREMAQKHANWVAGQEIDKGRDGIVPCQIAAALAFLGESEAE